MIASYFSFSMSGPSVREIVARLREVGLFPTGRPESIELLTKTLPVGDDWFERTLGMNNAALTFDERWTQVMYNTSRREQIGELVDVQLLDIELDAAELVQRLATVPFELACFGPLHLRWRNPQFGGYLGPSLGDGHTPVGWGIAYRGVGHRRLVSRRWIDRGPWRVHRGPDDTTLLQLHDLDADSTAALAEVQPAHDRLVAGALGSRHRFTTDLQSLYSARERSLIFVVRGRAIPIEEIKDAAAARVFQPLGADQPIERIRYVFLDRREAEAYLQSLLDHGHEVYAFDADGVERPLQSTT